MLYAAVFVGRYLDLFRPEGWHSFYLVFFKLFYIFSSFYIILLMMKVFPRTREREKAWKLALWSLGGSLILAPVSTLLYYKGVPTHWFTEVGCGHHGPVLFAANESTAFPRCFGRFLLYWSQSVYSHSFFSCARPPFLP